MDPYYENFVALIGDTYSGNRSYPSTPITGSDFPQSRIPTVDERVAAQQPSEYVDIDTRVKHGIADNGMPDPNATIQGMARKGTRKPTNSDIKEDGDFGGAEKPKYTEDQVLMYGKSASYLVSAANDFANALLARGNAKIKSSGYDFTARQNERMATLLEKNISDINRAAQLDANVYKVQREGLKSEQKSAMAASGFAVGKGVYRTTLATTDARTNYNIAMRMLKADLQTAETTRKAGTYRAQAAIERGNARIATIQGRNAMYNDIVSGVGNLINSGFSFYVGKWGLEGASDDGTTDTKTTKKSGGKQ